MIPSDMPAVNFRQGNSSATDFDFDFIVDSSSDLLVILYDTTNNTRQTLTYGTDYSIHAFSQPSGSYITYPLDENADKLTSNQTLILLSNRDIKQQYLFNSSANFDMKTFEKALDYIVTLIKQQQEKINRSIKVPVGADVSTDTLAADLIVVADNVQSVNTVKNSIANVNAVAGSISNVNAVAGNKTNIDTVAGNKTNIDTVAGGITSVNTVSNDINNVNVVAQNIGIVDDFSAEVDFVNNSKALTTGSVSGNATVYADILNRLHSSFDGSKFTVVGSPTITDGVASGFSTSNYITANLSNAITLDKINAYGEFTTGSTYVTFALIFNVGSVSQLAQAVLQIGVQSTKKLGIGCHSDTTWTGYFSTNTVSDNTTYNYHLYYSDNALKLDILTDGSWVNWINAKPTVNSAYSSTLLTFGSTSSAGGVFSGSIDLKQFSITVDGVEVFSGNKTGSDSYTINGSTVTVPYTLTKGGAKIADVSGRTDVTSVYNALGYAPYYTIDTENKDFTLPMGDFFGQTLFRNHKTEINEYLTLDTTNTVIFNYNTAYTAPSDGWIYFNTHLQTSANSGNQTSGIQVYGTIDNVVLFGHLLVTGWDYSSNTLINDTMEDALIFVKRGQVAKLYTDTSGVLPAGDYAIISNECRFIPCKK